jgi:outer membrane lipoprotein-sorting protein
MKKLMLLGALALIITSSEAQSPAPVEPQQLQALLKEVQAQQIQLAENQAKIDAKLVTLAEAIRIAKIYASRGGR